MLTIFQYRGGGGWSGKPVNTPHVQTDGMVYNMVYGMVCMAWCMLCYGIWYD